MTEDEKFQRTAEILSGHALRAVERWANHIDPSGNFTLSCYVALRDAAQRWKDAIDANHEAGIP